MRNRGISLLIALGLPAVLSAPLLAQHNEQNRTQMRGTPPGRITSLGGVRSQPGVRSAAPRSTATPIQVTPINRHSFSRPIQSSPRVRGDGGRGQQGGHDHGGHFGGDHGGAHFGGHFGPHRWPTHIGSHGLTISGSFQDGPFKLVFTTGGLTKIPLPKGGFIVPVFKGGCPAVVPFGFASCFAPFSWGYRGIVGPAWLDQQYAREYTTPVVVEAPEPARPLTPLEHAAALLRAGDSKAAAAAYQAYLKEHPLDAVAMRALGLSLIDSGQVGDGVAVIGLAYRSDSTLAEAPVSEGVFGKFSHLRSNLARVSAYANREKSASAWLTLAVLMQAEGRRERAMAMVNRARDAGLEDQIVNEMSVALTGKGGLTDNSGGG